MENYKEKINRGSKQYPQLTDRLYIGRSMYGHFLNDLKIRKTLISKKSLESCQRAKDLLVNGDEKGYVELLKEIENEQVVEPKIVVFNGKHGDDYYYINTYEQLKKVALHVLQERMDYWYITKWGVPDALDYTFEDIEKFPDSFKKEAKSKLAKRTEEIKEAKDNNTLYDAAVKALDEENGSLAWSILQNRADHEYEGFEIIEPHNL